MSHNRPVLLILVGVLCWCRPAAAQGQQGPFADVPAEHWAFDAVNELAAFGFVNGYPDAAYRGDRAMTRYEVAVAVQRVLQLPQRTDPPPRAWPHMPGGGWWPSDVPEAHWAVDAARDVTERGIFFGYPGDTFAGDRTMTRYELTVVLDRLLEWGIRFQELGRALPPGERGAVSSPSEQQALWQQAREREEAVVRAWRSKPVPPLAFPDVPGDHWAANAVAVLHASWGNAKGVLAGYANRTFAGDRALTRYEFAAALQRLIETAYAIYQQEESRRTPPGK